MRSVRKPSPEPIPRPSTAKRQIEALRADFKRLDGIVADLRNDLTWLAEMHTDKRLTELEKAIAKLLGE